MSRITRTLERRKRRIALIEHLGGKCSWCGFSDWRALQVDHVNDDGFIDSYGRDLAAVGQVAKAKEAFENNKLQLLCANCNAIKKFEKLESLRKLPGNLWKNYRQAAYEKTN